MDRRNFLTNAIAGAATAACASGLPRDALAFDAVAADLSVAEQFAIARRNNPRLIGFDNAPGELDFANVAIQGRIPEGLSGVFFRNGPAQHERGGERYHHWFDGDGFVHRWHIQNGRIGYRGRFVNTQKRREEIAAGRFLYPAGGGGIEGEAPMSGPDSVNVANTSILPINGQLWALWEGGSATRMDATSLETHEHVRFRDDLAGAPFSAHPRIGEDGRVWNIGYMGSQMVIYRLKPDGTLDGVQLHRVPVVGMVHDFLLTQKSVVVVFNSTRLSNSGDGLFSQVQGRADLPMQVKVYDRETLSLTREAELPMGFIFHFGNAWEDEIGTIRFDMVHSINCDQMQDMRRPMRGLMPTAEETMYHVTLPVTGAPRLSHVRGGVEFPRIAPSRNAQRNRYVYAAAKAVPGRSHWFDAVAKLDLETGAQSFATYGPDWLAEEHVFVPRPGSTREDDGWLIGTALNWRRQKTALSIFDAQNLTAGPLARAWLDVAMPLGFHGQFCSKLTCFSLSGNSHRDFQEDLASRFGWREIACTHVNLDRRQ